MSASAASAAGPHHAARLPPAQPRPARTGRRLWPAPTGKPVGAGVEDTPSLLNRLQVIGMAVVLLFGLASALIQFLSYQSDGRAADDTEQLVRVQEIQSSLLSVDAIATNLVLIGGEGDVEREEQYDDALDEVFRQIASAAEAQPADEKALAALNVEVKNYATAISEARAYIRQNYPVGKEYLFGASAGLRADALPILGNLVESNTARAEDSMGGQHPFLLLLVGAVAVGALIWLNLMLARRFRRYLNVGIAVAAVILVLTTLVATVAAWRGASQNDDLLDNELRMAIDQAEARTAGNDAKANESLRLINRGSGSKYEDPWQASADIVDDKADASIKDEWRAYVKAHQAIVDYDAEDRRGPAIQTATQTFGDLNSTESFNAFDAEAQALVEENGATTTDELRSGRTPALIGSLLTLVLGLVAAVAVARGIGARRKEFS